MTIYRYKALTEKGERKKGYVHGDSKEDIKNILRTKNLQPLYVWKVWNFVFLLQEKKNLSQLVRFFLYLEYATRSGKSIADALGEMKSSFTGSFRHIVDSIQQDVWSGYSLSEACAAYPSTFSPVLHALLTLGEKSGKFSNICEKARQHVQEHMIQKDRLWKVLSYPLFTSFLLIVAFHFILQGILPELLVLMKDNSAPPSFTTNLCMIISEFSFKIHGIYLTLFMAFFSGTYLLFLPFSRLWCYKIFFSYWPWKNWIAESHYSRFFGALHLLCHAEVPLMTALPASINTCSSFYLQKFLTRAYIHIQKGTPLWKAFQEVPFIRAFFLNLLYDGEKNGQIIESLHHVSTLLRYEITQRKDLIFLWISPILFCVIGIFLLLLIHGVFLPLYETMVIFHD